jgi:hypothetical protein
VIRPLWWLQGTGAGVGGSIDIGLHEIGLSGEATVRAIGPCDVDSRETPPGMSIVTGTIRHRNATVWNLTFDDRTEETLGVTANHPLYSETRHAWIPAGDLQLDEVVRTLNGHSTLTARTQHPTRETVFNLEVHRSHAYHVSELGVLAHNTGFQCPTPTQHTVTASRPGKTGPPNSIHEQVRPDGGRSITYFDDQGRAFSREDFGQLRPHKTAGLGPNGRAVPHEHKTEFSKHGPVGQFYRLLDDFGNPIGPWIPD